MERKKCKYFNVQEVVLILHSNLIYIKLETFSWTDSTWTYKVELPEAGPDIVTPVTVEN